MKKSNIVLRASSIKVSKLRVRAATETSHAAGSMLPDLLKIGIREHKSGQTCDGMSIQKEYRTLIYVARPYFLAGPLNLMHGYSILLKG